MSRLVSFLYSRIIIRPEVLTDHILELLAASKKQILSQRRLICFAVVGWPACGTPQEALKYHRLDGASLAERILEESDAYSA